MELFINYFIFPKSSASWRRDLEGLLFQTRQQLIIQFHIIIILRCEGQFF
jgi:hypothetical protein